MANETFYSTAAQVIPVLVLVLFVEHRSGPFGASDTPRSATVLRILVLVSLAWGEVAAFMALTGDAQSEPFGFVVIAAIVIGFAALIQPLFVRLAASLGNQAAAGVGGLLVVAPAAASMATGDDPNVFPYVAIASVVGLAVYYYVIKTSELRRYRRRLLAEGDMPARDAATAAAKDDSVSLDRSDRPA